MDKVEFRRWRDRNAKTGVICRSDIHLTTQEAALYPNTERVRGSPSVGNAAKT